MDHSSMCCPCAPACRLDDGSLPSVSATARRSLDAFRSPSDSSRYRVITLHNGLEALLIQNESNVSINSSCNRQQHHHEPETEDEIEGVARQRQSCSQRDGRSAVSMASSTPQPRRLAAACLSVGVGSLSDPPYMRGLAHYLEHMLFMGSDKYPDENAFEDLITRHGGYSNGMTECESTRFLFEVAPTQLPLALDMFAQFFVAPRFCSDAMARELQAVNAEYHRAKQNDYVRMQQVMCETSAPCSGFDAFCWGNTDSLKDEPERQGRDVREEMIAFYMRYYSASAMKLCVASGDGEGTTLDDLEQWVRSSFEAVPSRGSNCVPTSTMLPPFGLHAGQPPTLIKILPVRKIHALHLYWPMPSLFHAYRQKPWEYLAHAMGHEADGSLSAVLKQRLWATEVAVGISENDAYEFGSFGSLFEVNVSLTAQGLAHWEDVVALIFRVVRFIADNSREESDEKQLCDRSSHALSSWLFDELRVASEMNFRFEEAASPLERCRQLSELMQDRRGVDRQDLLRYDLLQGDFAPALPRDLLACMTPENARVVLLSHSFEQDAVLNESAWTKERWFGTAYSTTPISDAVLATWAGPATHQQVAQWPLSFPTPNPFMPQDFSVLPVPGDQAANGPHDEPKLILTTKHSNLWFKQDVLFRVPKASANFLFCLPSLTRCVETNVHAQLYVRVVYHALQHVQYQAGLAHLVFEVSVREFDLELRVSGFTDRLSELIHAVIDALLHTVIDANVVALVRDEMCKELRNRHLSPSVKAQYLRLQLLERTTFAIEDILDVLSLTSADDLRSFQRDQLWQLDADQEPSIRAMMHGNLNQEMAETLIYRVEKAVESHRATLASRVLTPSPSHLPQRHPRTTALPWTVNGLLLRDESEHDEDTNSVVEVYYQFGRGSYEDHAYADLLHQVISEPFFHQLRTQQQLGYDVCCTQRETHGVLGLSLTVQSSSHATGEIALRVDEFVHQAVDELLRDLSPDTLLEHISTLIRAKTRADVTLQDESDRYWEEIHNRRLAFRIDDYVVEALRSCTRAGLHERYQRWLLAADDTETDGDLDDVSKVRKLRVHIVGKRSKQILMETLVAEEQVPHIIDDLCAYKAALSCFKPLGGVAPGNSALA